MHLPRPIHALIQSEHPSLISWLADMRQAFAGCEVKYVAVGGFERGVPPAYSVQGCPRIKDET